MADHSTSSAIRSRNRRRSSTPVPNWRIEDDRLDPHAFRIACWLASHADHYLDRISRNEVSRRTGVSTGKVSSVLDELAKLGIVEIETIEIPQSEGGKRLLITLDFDVWEREPGHVMTGARSPDDQGPVTSRPGPGHVVTTSSEVDIEGKQKGRLTDAEASGESDPDRDGFEAFWAKYPRKIAKANNARKWARMTVTEREHANEGLDQWLAYWERTRTATEYIPHPATFLNQERYMDIPPSVLPVRGEHRAAPGLGRLREMAEETNRAKAAENERADAARSLGGGE